MTGRNSTKCGVSDAKFFAAKGFGNLALGDARRACNVGRVGASDELRACVRTHRGRIQDVVVVCVATSNRVGDREHIPHQVHVRSQPFECRCKKPGPGDKRVEHDGGLFGPYGEAGNAVVVNRPCRAIHIV